MCSVTLQAPERRQHQLAVVLGSSSRTELLSCHRCLHQEEECGHHQPMWPPPACDCSQRHPGKAGLGPPLLQAPSYNRATWGNSTDWLNWGKGKAFSLCVISKCNFLVLFETINYSVCPEFFLKHITYLTALSCVTVLVFSSCANWSNLAFGRHMLFLALHVRSFFHRSIIVSL